MKRFFFIATLVIGGVFLRWLTFPPLDVTVLVFIAYVPNLIIVRKLSPKRAAIVTFIGTYLFFSSTLAWMWGLGDNYLSFPFAGVIWAIVAIVASLCEGLFAYFAAQLRAAVRRGFPLGLALIGEAAIWAICEILRSKITIGCSWDGLAAAVTEMPFWIASARYVGAAGTSACLLLVNAIGAELLVAWRWGRDYPVSKFRAGITIGSLLIVVLAVNAFAWWEMRAAVTSTSETYRIVLYQTGNSKYDHETCVNQLATFSTSKSDLLLLPESAFSGCGTGDGEVARTYASRLLKASGATSLVAGAPWRKNEGREATVAVLYRINQNDLTASKTNSMATVEAVYWKRQLVPIGEYAPFSTYFPFIRRFISANEIPGDRHQRLFSLADDDKLKFGVLICFEGSFPELSRELVQDGAGGILHLVNDAWFVKNDGGLFACLRTSELLQHARQTALRSVETGLPIIRASEWGMTGVFYPEGKVQWLTARNSDQPLCFAPGLMLSEVKLSANQPPPYVWLGEWPIYLCAALILLAMCRADALKSTNPPLRGLSRF